MQTWLSTVGINVDPLADTVPARLSVVVLYTMSCPTHLLNPLLLSHWSLWKGNKEAQPTLTGWGVTIPLLEERVSTWFFPHVGFIHFLHLPVINHLWISRQLSSSSLETLPVATASLCHPLIIRFGLGLFLSTFLLLGISMTQDHLPFPSPAVRHAVSTREPGYFC